MLLEPEKYFARKKTEPYLLVQLLDTIFFEQPLGRSIDLAADLSAISGYYLRGVLFNANIGIHDAG